MKRIDSPYAAVVVSTATLVWLLGAAPQAAAGEESPLVYGLSEVGKLSLNATVLDSMKSNFDPDTGAALHERWEDLAVVGPDRYALRRDGLLYKNGTKLYSLPFSLSLPFQWVSMAVRNLNVFAIRVDGFIAVNGSVTISLPLAGADDLLFPFRQVVPSGSDIYSLRTDGAVFKNGGTSPIFQFAAGPGAGGLPDGQEADTIWTAIDVDPDNGDVYALRVDGHVFKGDPDAPGNGKGTLAAELPFEVLFLPRNVYLELAFAADGQWKVLRADGQIYTELHTVAPAVDYPGEADETDKIFVDMTIDGNDFWAVRRDGRAFRGLDTDPVLQLPKKPYGRIAIGTEPPDLSNFKNQKPVTAIYTVTAIEGEATSVPVLVTDVNTRSEELLVEPEEPLPPGSVWSADERVLAWHSPAPVGGHKFTVIVDDGEKPLKAKYSIKVKAPDLVPEKNKPPIPAKIKKVQALVDFELALPIFAVDPDGDEVSISVDPATYPFTAGAVFDPDSGLFTWTPTFDDIGKYKVSFFVSDGVKTKTLKVSIQVVSSLIF